MSKHNERAELKPCPFCGHTGLDFSEGSTFRWIVASCGKCGASRGETRIQTSGEGCKEQWMAEAQAEAIREWNQRAAMLEAQPAEQAKGQEAAAWLCPSVAPYFHQPLTHWGAEPPPPLTRQEAVDRGWFPVVKQDTTQPAQPAREWVGLTDVEIEKGRAQTFCINNPFCPCDSKTMRKAARWAESKLREKNAGHPAADDASDNAPWLTEAHMLCTGQGIPMGHITERIRALREKLAADGKAGGEDTLERNELTDSQIMASIGRHAGGEKTAISESRPLGQQWEQICELVRKIMNERGYTRPQPQAEVRVPDGYVLVPESALRWLFGEEGAFECPPEKYFRGKPPAYWWRSVFRDMLAAAPKPQDDLPTILKKQAS